MQSPYCFLLLIALGSKPRFSQGQEENQRDEHASAPNSMMKGDLNVCQGRRGYLTQVPAPLCAASLSCVPMSLLDGSRTRARLESASNRRSTSVFVHLVAFAKIGLEQN